MSKSDSVFQRQLVEDSLARIGNGELAITLLK